MTVKNIDRCPCGLPLHYEDKQLQHDVEGIIDKLGPNVLVEYDHKSYSVPRHYVALHGIKGKNVPALGFKPLSMINDIMRRK